MSHQHVCVEWVGNINDHAEDGEHNHIHVYLHKDSTAVLISFWRTNYFFLQTKIFFLAKRKLSHFPFSCCESSISTTSQVFFLNNKAHYFHILEKRGLNFWKELTWECSLGRLWPVDVLHIVDKGVLLCGDSFLSLNIIKSLCFR